MVFIVLGLVVTVSVIGIQNRNRSGNDRKELLHLWENGSYDETFRMSGDLLEEQPLDNFFLTMHGFSSYQLAIAQITAYNTMNYIDSCIWSLRKAMLTKEGGRDPRIRYVLGKAYYYKGPSYADLAILYLEEARDAGFNAADIPEYLGLSYAAVQDYRSSVASLTMALDPASGGGETSYVSDLRLLAIAQSYIGLGQADAAKAYLIRCIENSKDAEIIVKSRLLLGNILKDEHDIAGAEEQFTLILEEGGEDAEAHYQLGELYAAAGDTTRARAEWRRAVRIDPAHGPARTRLNM
ncbi:tetratricopeptide repeat protein [Breznakiella homolactica]|uniref:Tetratricopeptide repeat protein n=2 Tax=Breznakiella homolactica TaxID=2798577 RepID=A0A7T8BCG4_9SPIR|nr:tetratricopeptide repeat protein [Breznakiella homolactica]